MTFGDHDILYTAPKPQCLMLFPFWSSSLDYRMPQDEGRSSLTDFSLKATILYLVSMSTFWLLVVAGGVFSLLMLLK